MNKMEIIGLSIISCIIFMALLSFGIGSIIDFPKSKQYSPPSIQNPLGADDLGDDILKLLIIGSRTSLLVGFLGALFSTIIGTIIGALSGFFRGVLDDVLGVIIDVFLVIPALPLMIVLAAYLSPSFWNIVIVIGLLWWPTTARLVRARAWQLKSAPFIESLLALGAGKTYIVFKHVLPNVLGIASARFILSVSHAILIEAGLSFIGLGDPTNPSWGTMLHFAMTRGALLYGAWWTFIPPGLAISITSLAFIILGMGLEQRQKLSTRSMEDII
ncbi:MAG: ABC transporter permease [Candidatus Methanomethyliaceae archaeon]|nr:ABC transporter permease [Candidatus Methanomethyliaceae archaeon]